MTARRPSIPVILIHDHSLVGEGVVGAVRAQPGFRVLAPSAEISEALRLIRWSRPEVVLLNLPRAGPVSMALAGALHGEVPAAQVVVMGLEPMHEDVASLIRAGVSGFIMADTTFEGFNGALASVAGGIRVLPAELTHSLFAQLVAGIARGRRAWTSGAIGLSGRERAVTQLIAQGMGKKEIAARLQIALHVVSRHVHGVLSKLAATSRLEVASLPGAVTS